MSGCPSEADLRRLIDGSIPDVDLPRIAEHVEVCGRCRAWLAALAVDPEHERLARLASARDPHSEFPNLRALLDEIDDPVSQTNAQTARPIQADWREVLDPPTRSGDLGTLDAYRVRSVLGSGGMGVVLLAFDERLRREVAIKLLRPDLASVANRARFAREVRAVAAVHHDHVVVIHAESSTARGLPYCVFEYMAGGSLADWIGRETRIAPLQAAAIIVEVARGVAAANESDIVHRDVKPSNILFDKSTGRAKIADFGLARVESDDEGFRSQPSTRTGTPAYMSPEQARCDKDVGQATDIYSLGATLYEAMTGVVPFEGTPSAMLRRIGDEREEPRAPRVLNEAVPKDLQTICLKCLEKEPSKRYASAAELARDLGRFLEGRPILARPVSPWERTWRWSRHNRLAASLLLGLAALALLSAGLAVVAGVQTRTVARQRDEVETAFAALIASVDALLRPAPDELMKAEEIRPYFEGRINEGLELAEKVLHAFGNDTRSRQNKALALMMRAKLLAAKGDYKHATASADEAVVIVRKLVDGDRADIHNRQALAHLLHQISTVVTDRETARQHGRESNELYQRLLADTKDQSRRGDSILMMALNWRNIGHAYFEDGDLENAAVSLMKGRQFCEDRLASGYQDEASTALLAQIDIYLCRAHGTLAGSALRLGKPVESAEKLDRALSHGRGAADRFELLGRRHPIDYNLAYDIYLAHREIGMINFGCRRWKEAENGLEMARETLKRVEERFGDLSSRKVALKEQRAELDYNLLHALEVDPLRNHARIREINDDANEICNFILQLKPLSSNLKLVRDYTRLGKIGASAEDAMPPAVRSLFRWSKGSFKEQSLGSSDKTR